MVRRIPWVTSGFLLVLAACCNEVFAADADKQVNCNIWTDTDAVLVSDVTVGNSHVQCYWSPGPSGKYEPPPMFRGGDDWLKDLVITLINRTNKTIVYGLVGLGFPEAQPERTVNIPFGRIPAIAAFDRTGKPLRQEGQRPLVLPPGKMLIFKASEYADTLKAALDGSFEPITKVTVHLVSFYFEDGMHWNQGSYSSPDPVHPGQMKHVNTDYFPGNRYRNRPRMPGQEGVENRDKN